MHVQDKNSPLLDVGGTLGIPLAELQNAAYASRNPAMPAWTGKPLSDMQQPQGLQGHPMVENSPGFSPMSMELTNDTLQEGGALAFSLAGAGSGDTDSLVLNSFQAGAGGHTQNITDNVPGLSTLLEEDEEECYQESEHGPAMLFGAPQQSMREEPEEDNDVEMELTGTARLAGGWSRQLCNQSARYVARTSNPCSGTQGHSVSSAVTDTKLTTNSCC